MKLEEQEKLQAIFEEYKVALSQQYEGLQKTAERLAETQQSKPYRIGLMIRRFEEQVLHGHEKKDFFRWLWSKVIRKDAQTRLLKEFDPLQTLRQSVQSSILELGELLPGLDKRFIVREGEHVFIFASVPFFDVGGGQRSAQLARTFTSLGKKVYYIYGYPCTEKDIPEMILPVAAHRELKDINTSWFSHRVSKGDLVLFELPMAEMEPYLDAAKEAGAYTVYEHIDNWDTSLGAYFYREDVFRRYLEKVDLITVTAKMLGEKIREHTDREYLYLPNAVNVEIFEPGKHYECPDDLVRGQGRGKTLLYFGSLWGEWFDWEKIRHIARQRPECHINLIGDCSNLKSRMSLPSNVHFLGLKKQTDLPAYLSYTDIALLPFKNCEIGKYVSPLKIFEYIAMNVKVLSTSLDDIQDYPNVICADTEDEWLRALDNDEPLQDSRGFIARNNWFARCQELIRRAGLERTAYPKVSVVVLNHNNKKVIFRCVDSLLNHRGRADYEIIVVDNASTDGSCEMLEEKYGDKIVLLKNPKNGCSSGRNLGAQAAGGEFLCFLDSDQWVVSDYWLDSVLRLLETHPEVGASGWNAGWFSPGSVKGPIVDGFEYRAMPSGHAWARRDVAYLATSGLVMRKSMFDRVGGLDEFYDPTCFEDTDLSVAVRAQGYEMLYCPSMAVMHIPHQTTNSGSAAHTALMDRNSAYFREKWGARDPGLLEYYYHE